MPRLVAIGECMIELSLGSVDGGQCSLAFAGDTLNTAVYLKRCSAPDVEVSYATVIGTDALSDNMLSFFLSEGLQTDCIARHPQRVCGLYAIATDKDGERSFTYWREASAARELFRVGNQVGFDHLNRFDVLYFSAITLAILPSEIRDGFLSWLPGYRAGGGQVAFDSNYRPGLWPDVEMARHAVSEAFANCDIALPSIDDEMALFGDQNQQAVLDRLRGYGLKNGALKNGALGPVAIDPEIEAPPLAPATQIVDTTAAGDSFNGAYLAAHLSGQSPQQAMAAGHACALKVIAHRGAIIDRAAM